ncbi:hypothetical protein AL0124_1323 [Bifidobacterium adolescentis]|uniref:hypothetical protein n=1 Tax=Bifidobacterium adolescentis TaxID=1680 RepID=UPI000A19A4A7|nr:hypothetical protein [Bifidobacterium adolescentis]OSG90835.1 hypothetical protein AL0124_1323 [Bifidobacterium adolescentis]
MSDENNETTGTTANVEDGILDLRPPKSGIVYQLLRLGLTFDHKDADGETWTDYQRGVTATFTDRQATEATIADMDTKDSETITATQLAQVTEIKTWRSDGAED